MMGGEGTVYWGVIGCLCLASFHNRVSSRVQTAA